ncbi:hypothetical protein, variant [Aphanomyces invadans]|uniref:Uncharacterized protein n=1 Tax=Aphanomyces invadans TaxID=157072 RepID=A0A024TUV0_9STRA|nr:hypothetical protein, variant [Aphanomyces invadans]ETV97813.1 hypothetical protein, variant [Aphanomyces invadans]|eukprot:XP_008873374.1 hypothetical protein, variant [Aphanomyces invadans]
MPSKPGTGDPSMAHGVHQRLQRLGSTKMMDKAMESTSRSKERTTSMSRNGSLHVVPKGTKHSVSVRKPMKGHPDVELLMADVFAEMDRQRQRGQIKFPSKFADFFHHDMMVEFVKACMQLADTFVAVQHLELAIALHSPPSPPATVNSPLVPPSIATMPDSERTLAYHKAVANHSDSVANLAKWYSRVVLNCSNFERHEEDRTFFEAVYYFVCAIVKTTHPPDTWPLIEEELGYAFRGEVFNVHGKSNLQPPMAPEPAKVSATRFGQPTTAHHAPDPLAGDLKFSPRAAIAYGSYGQNISLASIVARVDATTSRAEHNVKVSQAMRDRIHGQRNEDHKARRQLERAYNQRSERRAAARLDHLVDSPSKPLRPLPSFVLHPDQNPPSSPPSSSMPSPRASMRHTLDARSPIVAHIFPSAQDQVLLTQTLLDAQQRDRRSSPCPSPQPPLPRTTRPPTTRLAMPRFQDIHGLTEN